MLQTKQLIVQTNKIQVLIKNLYSSSKNQLKNTVLKKCKILV